MLWPLLAATLGTVGRKSQVINASSTDPHILPSHQRSRKERLPGSESQRASSPAPRAPSTPALRVHTSAAQPTRERPASGVTPTAGPHSYQVKLQPIPPGLCCSRSRASRGRALWFTPGDTGSTWKGCDQARAGCFYHTLHRLLNILRSWFFILICILKISFSTFPYVCQFYFQHFLRYLQMNHCLFWTKFIFPVISTILQSFIKFSLLNDFWKLNSSRKLYWSR